MTDIYKTNAIFPMYIYIYIFVFYNIYIYISNNVYFCWVRPFCCYSSLAFFFDSSASRKAFTPAKISPGFCIARTWSYGRGKLCRGRLCRWVVRDLVSHGEKNRRKKHMWGVVIMNAGIHGILIVPKCFFEKLRCFSLDMFNQLGLQHTCFQQMKRFAILNPFWGAK